MSTLTNEQTNVNHLIFVCS